MGGSREGRRALCRGAPALMRNSFQRMARPTRVRMIQGLALSLAWMPLWMRSSTRGTATKIVGFSAAMSSVSFLTSP